jgi:hypothetical protein
VTRTELLLSIKRKADKIFDTQNKDYIEDTIPTMYDIFMIMMKIFDINDQLPIEKKINVTDHIDMKFLAEAPPETASDSRDQIDEEKKAEYKALITLLDLYIGYYGIKEGVPGLLLNNMQDGLKHGRRKDDPKFNSDPCLMPDTFKKQ